MKIKKSLPKLPAISMVNVLEKYAFSKNLPFKKTKWHNIVDMYELYVKYVSPLN